MRIESDVYYCYHLGENENDAIDISDFEINNIKGHGLLQYIQCLSFRDEEAGIMRTYIVRDKSSEEIVAYFSLKAGLISSEEIKGERDNASFSTFPGVEMADFAVNDKYVAAHPSVKGVGLVVFGLFVLPIIRKASEYIGITVLYIFALPYEALIARYKDYGFKRLSDQHETQLHKRLKPTYDEECIFMYMNI